MFIPSEEKKNIIGKSFSNKITMYELLGLVKDDKAPKRIKYHNEILYFYDDLKNYYNDEGMHELFNCIGDILNDEVEIIEEKEVPKIPEKIPDTIYYDTYLHKWDKNENYLVITINEIIDYLKSKGDE